MFFGVVAMAAFNWPERMQFQPEGNKKEAAEHLRAWLLVEVGHCEALFVPNEMVRGDPAKIVEIGKFFCDGKKHFRLKQAPGGMSISRPLSIKKTECKVDVFRDVSHAVFEIIDAATGITPELYKREQEARKQRTTGT